jgi:hypothetical protein
MKKTISLVLTLIICFTSTLAYASTGLTKEGNASMTTEQVNKRLIELGFTMTQISTMSEMLKNDIAADNTIEKLMSFEQGGLKEKSATSISNTASNNAPIVLQGTIPSDTLRMNLIAVSIGRINNKQALRVYADFEWLLTPVWTLTDHIAIYWSYGWLANSHVMKYTYYNANEGQMRTEDGNAYDTQNRETGIAWNYNLQMSMFTDPIYGNPRPSGYAYVNLIKNSDDINPAYYSQANAAYAHEAIYPNGSISFTPSAKIAGAMPSISIGGSLTTDSLIKSTTWKNSDILNQ